MFGFLQIIMQTIAHHHGWGRHFFFLTNEQRTTSMEFIFVSEPLGKSCLTPFQHCHDTDGNYSNHVQHTWPRFIHHPHVPTFRKHKVQTMGFILPRRRTTHCKPLHLHHHLYPVWRCPQSLGSCGRAKQMLESRCSNWHWLCTRR